jgi:hypothetical protein
MAALPLGILAILAALDAPLCPSRFLFGLPCPGCGLTRATASMLVFDWGGVWRFHPLAPVLAPVVLWFLARPILEEAGAIEKGKVLVKVPNAIWWSLLVALLGLYALRVAGLLGGLPDPIDPSEGLIARALGWLAAR